MKLTGKITAWTPRGYGYITVRDGIRSRRYYLHISKIASLDLGLEEPAVGCQVVFEVTDKFRRHPTDHLSAINAEVDAPLSPPPDEVIELLSGRVPEIAPKEQV